MYFESSFVGVSERVWLTLNELVPGRVRALRGWFRDICTPIICFMSHQIGWQRAVIDMLSSWQLINQCRAGLPLSFGKCVKRLGSLSACAFNTSKRAAGRSWRQRLAPYSGFIILYSAHPTYTKASSFRSLRVAFPVFNYLICDASLEVVGLVVSDVEEVGQSLYLSPDYIKSCSAKC